MQADGGYTQDVHAIVDCAKNRRSTRGVVECCGAAYYAKNVGHRCNDESSDTRFFYLFVLAQFGFNLSIMRVGESKIVNGSFGSYVFFAS